MAQVSLDLEYNVDGVYEEFHHRLDSLDHDLVGLMERCVARSEGLARRMSASQELGNVDPRTSSGGNTRFDGSGPLRASDYSRTGSTFGRPNFEHSFANRARATVGRGSTVPRESSAEPVEPNHEGPSLDESFAELSDVLDRSCPDDHEHGASFVPHATAFDDAHTHRYHTGPSDYHSGTPLRSLRTAPSTPLGPAEQLWARSVGQERQARSSEGLRTRSGFRESAPGGMANSGEHRRASGAARVTSANISDFPSDSISIPLSQKEYTSIIASRATRDATQVYA
jgi:hypothetical protein